MTKTKCYKRKRVSIKLNTLRVKNMVHDIMDKLYGRTPYGRGYGIEDTALKSLQESAERFLEDMWEQLRDLSNDNVVTIEHVHTWKRTTGFKPRFKKNNISLCEIFNK